ncbi:hypothetical protein [Streptomyces nigrescens]|uniref:Uncharacterized protein n=1 Tax=Streptomyces nigrescens TaxID=1920 RepID=A0ABY7IX98_STRNI|nr:hypothetical protein [Streptomyces nigrescens]WAU02066.1 hypothetical protein STRNI_000016 [Streptomyces nigrescens]
MPTALRDVVRYAVELAAPEELPLLDGLTELDDVQAERALTSRSRARERLGFGLTEAVALVTPVLWTVLSEAGRHAVGLAVDGAVERLRARLRRRRADLAGADRLTLPPMPPERIEEIRHAVRERCLAAGVNRARAVAVADAVAVRLAMDELRSNREGGDPQQPGPAQ